MTKTTLSLVVLLALAAATADAQPAASSRPAGRDQIVYIDASLGLKMTTTSFASTTHPVEFVEPSTVQSNYRVPSAMEFDLGGGVKVTRSVAVGVALSRFTKGGDVGVDAQVPHPFFFARPRPVSGTEDNLTREETALHARILWVGAMAQGWIVSLGGGPSFFRVGQDLVDGINVNQTYPYDTATFASVVSTRHTGSAAGFNVIGDVTRLLSPHVGVGVAAGFTRAKVDLTESDTTKMTVVVGGAHVAGGIRFRF